MIRYEFRLFLSQVKRFRVPFALVYYFRWKRSLRPDTSPLAEKKPWITFKAIGFIKKWLRKDHRVFEYGGGGSSLFFAGIVNELVTVEHNKEWFAQLEKLESSTGCRWTRIFHPPGEGDLVNLPDPSEPSHYSSADIPSKNKNYRSYVEAIDQFPENYFDLVMVDGRSRPACIVHGFRRLKKEGLMVIDNAEREYYFDKNKEVLKKMRLVCGGMAPVPYSRDFSDTSIWIKVRD